jgi:hypothetical protein
VIHTASRKKHHRLVISWLIFSLAMLAIPVQSQQVRPQIDLDDYNLSYIYAAVLGSGTYKIDGRRITQLQAKFSFTQKEMTDTDIGYSWVAPVGIGYDAVTDNNWLEQIFSENLVTMPGFIAHIPLDDTWTLKPLGNLGLTRDFTNEETIVLGVLGLRALGKWQIGDSQELRWGGGVKLAGEYQLKSYDSLAFTVLETGLDYRRDTGFDVLDRKVNAGIYAVFQHFEPNWEITDTPVGRSEVLSILELGVSFGLKRPRKFLGIPINRVRVGYQQGKNFRGWSFGTEFPF